MGNYINAQVVPKDRWLLFKWFVKDAFHFIYVDTTDRSLNELDDDMKRAIRLIRRTE